MSIVLFVLSAEECNYWILLAELQGVRTLPLSLSSLPLTGWEVVSVDNYKEKYVPKVMSGEHIIVQYTTV